MDMIVVVVGDSLGCPRPWVGVDLSTTYSFQLNRILGSGAFVANYSVGDNSTDRAVKEPFLRTFIRESGASFAIIQLGIVDCAPRLLSPVERALGVVAGRVPWLGTLFNEYIKLKSRYRYQLTKIFPRELVPIARFKSNYLALVREIVESNPIKTVFAINIAYPGEILRKKSFNILANIQAYNAVIEDLAEVYQGRLAVVDLFTQCAHNPDWITQDDGHHIHKPAHDWIAAEIAHRISVCSCSGHVPDCHVEPAKFEGDVKDAFVSEKRCC
jgi:lysophospholipase L1-like esterase